MLEKQYTCTNEQISQKYNLPQNVSKITNFIEDITKIKFNFSQIEIDLLNCEAFHKRLANIAQRGIITHQGVFSRLFHTLFYLNIAIDILQLTDTSNKTSQYTRLAILLHDIGHFCNSHTFEKTIGKKLVKVMGPDFTHKKNGKNIVNGDSRIPTQYLDIHQILKDNNIEIQSLLQMMFHKQDLNPLNNSGFNLDHFVASIHDNIFAGTLKDVSQIPQIIHNIQFAELKQSQYSKQGILYTTQKTANSIMNLIHTKNHLYFCDTNNIIDYLSNTILQHPLIEDIINKDNFMITDYEMKEAIIKKSKQHKMIQPFTEIIFAKDQIAAVDEFSIEKINSNAEANFNVPKVYIEEPNILYNREFKPISDVSKIAKGKLSETKRLVGLYRVEISKKFKENKELHRVLYPEEKTSAIAS